MTGAHHGSNDQSPKRRLRVATLVWLLSALSLLQWIAPSVDPWLLSRLGEGATLEPPPAAAEHPSPAVEARSTAAPAAFEARPAGQRSLPSNDDLDAVPHRPNLTIAGEFRDAPHRTRTVATLSRDSHSTTARSPPGKG